MATIKVALWLLLTSLASLTFADVCTPTERDLGSAKWPAFTEHLPPADFIELIRSFRPVSRGTEKC